MSVQSEDQPRSLGPGRVLVFYLLILVWIVGLLVRLVDLQVFQSDYYRKLAQGQGEGHTYLRSKRGEILDRNLRELAVSVETGSIGAQAGRIQNFEKTARALGPFLRLDGEKIREKLTSNTGFTYLARKIPPHQVPMIRDLKLPGIQVDWEVRRAYPKRELAAHVLGFVGLENEGLGGIEYLYDGVIRGEMTRVNLMVDGRRHVYGREWSGSNPRGNILVLNLDESIQYSVEQVLGETVSQYEATSGSAIVMNVNSGEVLAMASYPTFNPNKHSDYDQGDYRNRAILDIYEPGSTFKIVTLAAVLEDGLSQPGELVDCRVGTVRLGGKVYREAKRSFQTLSFNQILAKSSNVGTIKLGLRLGDERLYSYILRFGFGRKSGIELPGEQVGLLAPPERWSKISIGALSIGQEIGVTPVQMIQAMAALGNGGYLVKPRLVRRVLSENGEVIEESRIDRQKILSSSTAQAMKNALGQVVEQGTGRRAQLTGYSAGGKTGTAQKFVGGSYSKSRFVASFVGIAPLSNPVLAALVVIDEPQGSHYGGVVAAPAFRRIMERALINLKVPVDRPILPQKGILAEAWDEQTDINEVSAFVSDEPLPQNSLEQTVLNLIKHRSPTGEGGRTVKVKTGVFPLPDLSGLSLRQVLRKTGGLSLRLKVSGSGRVVAQRPAPGTPVFAGAVCQVYLTSVEASNHETQQLALASKSEGVLAVSR